MYRCPPRDLIMWWLRLGAVLVVVAAPAIALAQTQDRTTDDRLDRIERDLNMLERQVYRGAPTAVAPGVGGAGRCPPPMSKSAWSGSKRRCAT